MKTETKGQLYFGDVQVGMEIPSSLEGPVSMTTVVKFAAASGDFAPIHHDGEVAKARGLPGPVIMGSLKWAHICKWLTDWIGMDGDLCEVALRLTQMDLVGDTLVCKGKVINKYVKEGKNYVECDVVMENTKNNKPSVTGKAIVLLPSRK